MSKTPLIVASILSALVLMGYLGLCAWQNHRDYVEAAESLRQAQDALEKQSQELNELKERVAASESEMDTLKPKLAESQAQIKKLTQSLGASQGLVEQLKKDKEAATQAQTSLEQEMRATLESKDVTISQLQGKLTVNILDRILFDSGEAVLKPDGEAVLEKVAKILAQHPQLKIHVIGHTDNVPIRASAWSRFPSNWELSTGRATAAVRFLTEKAGVDPQRVGAIGYGEFRPIAENSTPEGRARNRRIAITVLSEELAGADIVPTATTNVPVVLPEPARDTNSTVSATPPNPARETNVPAEP